MEPVGRIQSVASSSSTDAVPHPDWLIGGQRSPSPQHPSSSINQQFMSFLNNLKLRLKMPSRAAANGQQAQRNMTSLMTSSSRQSANVPGASNQGMSFVPTARRQLADGWPFLIL